MTAVEPGKLTTVSKLRVGVTVHAELMPSRLGPDAQTGSEALRAGCLSGCDSLEEKVDNPTGALLVDWLSGEQCSEVQWCDQ